MARRMDIELTSQRDDDTWTWRAAGARQPKGTLDAALLPPATKVGDVVRAEVEGFLDGMTVVGVLPPKAPRSEPERLELLSSRSSDRLVTTSPGTRSGRGRTERPRRGERPARGDRDHGRRRPERERGDRGERGPDRGRDGRRDRDRDRPDRERVSAGPAPDAKPKPKRLRPAKVHRTALLEALPAEQRPIAEQLLQGGIPAVRQAIEKQNEELKSAGKPQVNGTPLLEIAEKLWPRVQAATWRDRADAALTHVDELDLRDLRSVVNAAEDAGRDEEARTLAHQLREALANRVEKEQAAWVSEVADNLREGRIVRALRLTSRPPKAGSPVPPDLADQLVAATGEALTADTGPQRWATVLDALAYSPIRRRVVPSSLPEKLAPDLREVIARLASRLPEIAHIFDITPAPVPSRPARPARRRSGKKGGGGGDGAATSNGRSARGQSKKGAPEGAGSPAGDGSQAEAPAGEAPLPETEAEAVAADATTTDQGETLDAETAATLADDQPESPTTDATEAPVDDAEAPTDEQPDSPNTEEPEAPTDEHPESRNTEASAAPADEQPGSPNTEASAEPATADSPSTEQAEAPTDEALDRAAEVLADEPDVLPDADDSPSEPEAAIDPPAEAEGTESRPGDEPVAADSADS